MYVSRFIVMYLSHVSKLNFKLHKLFVLTLTFYLVTKVLGVVVALLSYDNRGLSFLCWVFGPTALSSESVVVGHGRLMGHA